MIAIMGTVKEWFGKHLYFSKATMCIRGLVFSHSFIDHAIMSMLIVYLSYYWGGEHFQMAAVFENVRDGLSEIMVIFLAHMSHTYWGCFKVIVTTNAAFVVGLGILWWSAEQMSEDIAVRVFYGAAVLLTLGETGRSAALKEFLDEQYLSEQDQKECIEDEKLQDRQKALWNLPWFLGAVVALSLLNATWQRTFQISTIVMGVFYLFFWVGYYYFIYSKSPRVSKAETMHPIEEAKRDETCIDMEELAEPAGRGNFWSVMTKKLKDRKHLRYEILAVWLTFLVYSVVAAAGGTFFFEQLSSNLREPIENTGIIFNLLGSSSKYITSFLWELQWKSNTRMRIGCGMVCTVLCCVAACLVESHRLFEVNSYGFGNDTTKTIPMSIFWLVPQFSLLGIMEGLAVDGLKDFVVDRLAGDDDKAMVEYYGSHTTDFVIGVGKFLTALSIVVFRRRWFDGNINMSRLDKYYEALIFMSVVSFFFYVCVSTYYYCTKDVSQDHAGGENGTNSHRIEQQESPPSQQNLSTSRQEPSQLEPSPPSQQEQPLHSHQDFQCHQQLSPLQRQQPYQESPLSPQNYRPQGYPPQCPLQAHSPQSSLPQPQYPLPEKTKDVPSTGGQ